MKFFTRGPVPRRNVSNSTGLCRHGYTQMLGAAALAMLGCARIAAAVNIQGVYPVAADQPQINALITDPATGKVLTTSAASGSVYDIQAFLDTGTSGILLSRETQQALGVALATYNGSPVVFNDVAVGGLQPYNVSTPYDVSTAPFSINNDVTIGGTPPPVSAYTNTVGPLQMEVSQTAANSLVGPLDIMGTPVMQGKVTVLDIRPANSANINNLGETKTYIYNPGTPYNPSALDTNPGIVPTAYQVKLSYASFNQFTSTTPTGATSPEQAANPFVGPNPLDQLSSNPPTDTTPPVTISYGSNTATGSFLLDTGAQSSFISKAVAGNVDVKYAAGVNAAGNPYLINSITGAVIPNQFTETVLGAGGGAVTAAGFYLNSLSLKTVQGQSINYLGAPVLVQNVTVKNPTTGQSLTLNGDLGMNFFEPSTNTSLSTGSASPYTFMTIDQPNGLLGLTLAAVPEPATLMLLLFAAPVLLLRRRRVA